MFKRVMRVCLIFVWAFFALTIAQANLPGDNRDNDRAEIRAHIESIFQAFIDKDVAKLRATHSEDWRGFLEGSRVAIKGIEEYMEAIGAGKNEKNSWMKDPNAGMKSYKITSYDVLFHGPDLAVVSFVADVENRSGGSSTLRILDVYARRNGHWIQAGSHTTVHPLAIAKQMAAPTSVSPEMRKQILEAREAVWRAWFTNDQAKLDKLIPEDAVAINSGSEAWSNRAEILSGAAEFAKSGSKLVRLEFPRTDIQMYGRTIIIYTTYIYELENNGKRATNSGRGTEIFVVRDGQLVNTGWHLDSAN